MLEKLVSPTNVPPNIGSDLLQMVQFRADDFAGDCSPKGNGATFAYTALNPSSQIDFCNRKRRNAFVYPDLGDINYASFEKRVSYKMLPLAYVLIHELT